MLPRLLFEATEEARERYKLEVNENFRQIDRLALRALVDGRRSVDDLKNRLLIGLQDGPPLTILNFESQLTPALNRLLFDWAGDLEYKHAGLFQVQALSLGFDLADQVLPLLGVSGPPRPTLRELQTARGSIVSGNTRSWIYKAVTSSMKDIKDEARQALLAGKDPDKALRGKELWERVNSRAARAIQTWQTEAVARATDIRLVQLAGQIDGLKKQFITGGKDPCPECKSFATRVFDVIGETRGPRLPLHPSCECAYHPAEQKLRIAEDLSKSLPFPHSLSNRELLSRVGGELSLLPPSLIGFWSENFDAHLELVVSEPGSEFAAAYAPSRRRAHVEALTWLRSPGVVLEEATHILDHALGVPGKTFSAGGGVNPAVSALGKRFSKLFEANPKALGEYASKNSREYLAWSVRLYHSNDKARFQRENPEVFEFIEQVWLNEETWKEALK